MTTTTKNQSILVPESLDEATLKTLEDVKKVFTEAEIVEIVKRYVNIRFMQRKNMKQQLAKRKAVMAWAKEAGVLQKLSGGGVEEEEEEA